MMMYAILGNNHEVIPVEYVLEWANMFEDTGARIVAKDRIGRGNVEVSTVFLGINHSFFGNAPPLWFETMIFGGHLDGYQERCTTWDQAVAQHEIAKKKAEKVI